MGSYDQHLVGTKKDMCYKRCPKGVDLFSELQGGKGLKKNDSDKFWRQFFITYAEKVALKNNLFSPNDIAQQTNQFKGLATEKLAELCYKYQTRNFFYLERDGVKAMLFSPFLVSGKVKGLCVCSRTTMAICADSFAA